MISKISLENFSAFKNIELDCSLQTNVIVGENTVHRISGGAA